MTKKRSSRVALLACAGVASVGLMAGASPAAAKTKTATFNQCLNANQAIPNGPTGTNPASLLAFSIPVTVPKFKGKPQDGVVTAFNSAGVRITHTADSDLQINLVSPGGKVSTLANKRGGSGDGYGTGSQSCGGSLVQFTDTAATSIVTPGNTTNNPITGTFRPESAFITQFVGGPARGFWTLIVEDTSSGANTGTLDAASLNFTYQYKVKPKKKKK